MVKRMKLRLNEGLRNEIGYQSKNKTKLKNLNDHAFFWVGILSRIQEMNDSIFNDRLPRGSEKTS